MKTFFTVHAVVINRSGEYLILQRANHRTNPGSWNVITGHVQERESAEDAALRELKEETNLEGETIETTEPFWVDTEDKRWVVVSSLIKVKDVDSLKIDPNESSDYRWIKSNDPIVNVSRGINLSFKKLNILL